MQSKCEFVPFCPVLRCPLARGRTSLNSRYLIKPLGILLWHPPGQRLTTFEAAHITFGRLHLHASGSLKDTDTIPSNIRWATQTRWVTNNPNVSQTHAPGFPTRQHTCCKGHNSNTTHVDTHTHTHNLAHTNDM